MQSNQLVLKLLIFACQVCYGSVFGFECEAKLPGIVRRGVTCTLDVGILFLFAHHQAHLNILLLL